MSEQQPLREGQILAGPLFSEPMRVETVRPNGPNTWVAGLVGMQSERFRKVTLTSRDLEGLTILDAPYTYDGDGRLLRLGLQAYSFGVHMAMLLQAGGRANALRALLRAEQERGPGFLRLANALSALYPKGSEEKGLLDAMLPAAPR